MLVFDIDMYLFMCMFVCIWLYACVGSVHMMFERGRSYEIYLLPCYLVEHEIAVPIMELNRIIYGYLYVILVSWAVVR